MEIYHGPHLILTYEQEHSRFVNSWTSSPKDIEAFKQEMLEYLFFLEKFNPSQILWLQKNYTFQIDDETKLWVEEKIMKPRFEAGFIGQDQDGFHHIAFVVGEDVLAHIKVMDVFDEKFQSVFKPKHFASEAEAIHWLNKVLETSPLNKVKPKTEIAYKGVDNLGRAIIEVKKPASEISNTIKSFKTILEENQFMKNNVEKYSSLSQRERETLKFIIKGYTNQQIAEKMYVSPHTIRTHRNRIWKKLEIKHFRDCLRYQSFFD